MCISEFPPVTVRHLIFVSHRITDAPGSPWGWGRGGAVQVHKSSTVGSWVSADESSELSDSLGLGVDVCVYGIVLGDVKLKPSMDYKSPLHFLNCSQFSRDFHTSFKLSHVQPYLFLLCPPRKHKIFIIHTFSTGNSNIFH